MKRLMKLLVIAIVLFLPIMVSAKPNVEITKVVLGTHSENTEIVKDATFDGLNVNFDVKFSEVGDYVIYKVTIRNNDNKSYELEQGKVFNGSKYISYETKYDGGNIIKAKSTKQATITISYDTEVPAEKYVDGKFEEADNMTISLGDRTVTKNPKTAATTAIILLVLLLLAVGTVVVIKGNTKAKLLTVMLLTLAVPFTTLAISRVTITINAKVLIEKVGEFCVVDPTNGKITKYEYQYGQTITQYCKETTADKTFCETFNYGKLTETNDPTQKPGSFVRTSLLNCFVSEYKDSSNSETVPTLYAIASGLFAYGSETYNNSNCAKKFDSGQQYKAVLNNSVIQSADTGCYHYFIEEADDQPSSPPNDPLDSNVG